MPPRRFRPPQTMTKRPSSVNAHVECRRRLVSRLRLLPP
jgi:hypothetical protein